MQLRGRDRRQVNGKRWGSFEIGCCIGSANEFNGREFPLIRTEVYLYA